MNYGLRLQELRQLAQRNVERAVTATSAAQRAYHLQEANRYDRSIKETERAQLLDMEREMLSPVNRKLLLLVKR